MDPKGSCCWRFKQRRKKGKCTKAANFFLEEEEKEINWCDTLRPKKEESKKCSQKSFVASAPSGGSSCFKVSGGKSGAPKLRRFQFANDEKSSFVCLKTHPTLRFRCCLESGLGRTDPKEFGATCFWHWGNRLCHSLIHRKTTPFSVS